MQENYNAMKLDALRELAKSREIKGFAAMRKAELIEALEGSSAPGSSSGSKEQPAAGKKPVSRKKKAAEETLTPIEEALIQKETSPKKETASKKATSAKKETASKKETSPKKETTAKKENATEKKTVSGKKSAAKKDAAAAGENAAKEEKGAEKDTASENTEAPEKTVSAAPEAQVPSGVASSDDSDIPAPEEQRPQRTLPKPNTHGKLDIMASGYGFIRSINPETGVKRDVYIANSFIRKFNLKSGDIITGNSHPTSRFDAIFYITAINGISPMDLMTGKKTASSETNEAASESTTESRSAASEGAEPSASEPADNSAREEVAGTAVGSAASAEKERADSAEAPASAPREDRSGDTAEGTLLYSDSSEEPEPENPQNSFNEYHSNIETREIEGVYELMPDGYGFLRCNNYIPSDQDIFVSPPTIRRLNLKAGDYVKGVARVTERFDALIKIYSINGLEVDSEDQVRAFRNRIPFENMTPIFPNERIHLENPSAPHQIATRIIDLVSPIGKGQRGMIVSPPKAGKTTLLKQIARSIQANHPEIHLIVLLIDERPEEVTDMKESIGQENSEVVYSTFDKEPDNHCRVSEMVIERAKRLVEAGKDVVILLDSITRLARAYNLVCDPSGRTLSGGLDPTALLMPKRFFGAARNMREGGSLTVLATALVDTGSRMDDVVFEEFKGTGNMEIVLDRSLSERRIFPAIDILKSGTRREDLLLTNVEAAAMNVIRRSTNVARQEEAVEHILQMFARTDTNRDFLVALNQMYKRGSLS